MDNVNQLPLRDIHLPDPASWWPLAYGWWLLLVCAVVVGVVAWLGTKIIRAHLKRRRFRKVTLKQLKHIEEAYLRTGDAKQLLEQLSVLLRRVALSLYARDEVAGVVGNDWVQWLNASSNSQVFDARVSALLTDAPYRETANTDVLPLLESCRGWITQMVYKRVSV